MSIDEIPILNWLFVAYRPNPSEREFVHRAVSQTIDDVDVSIAVLDAKESRTYFGAPLARRGIQPVWLRITNRSSAPLRLSLVGIDPKYFSPLEAAAKCHFSSGKRLLAFGLLAWLVFFPLWFLLPLKLFGAWRANRRMDALFQEHALRLKPIEPGQEMEGFAFTNLDQGSKVVHVNLLGIEHTREFLFTIPIKGLDADYLRREYHFTIPSDQLVECDHAELRQRLATSPPATTNRDGSRSGDPANLVVIGEFATVISAFAARWNETEAITLASCRKTFRAFLTGAEYRYSPVSSLYMFGRNQDFALQRIRQSINERLHLRLWATPLRYRKLPVWIGQVSRDIGVRLTWRTWNLTTHRVDADVDEARDYVVEDLWNSERLELATYVPGVGPCDAKAPRHNLTGDPYYTDGMRAVVIVSPNRTKPRYVSWTEKS